jgi:hypothetical protein
MEDIKMSKRVISIEIDVYQSANACIASVSFEDPFKKLMPVVGSGANIEEAVLDLKRKCVEELQMHQSNTKRIARISPLIYTKRMLGTFFSVLGFGFEIMKDSGGESLSMPGFRIAGWRLVFVNLWKQV